MILRRFMQHVDEQNWFAVGLDLIVVITGIFLGMQVTDWNEERLNRALETEYLQRLQVDIQTNIVVLEETENIYKVLIGDILKVISIVEGEEPLDKAGEDFVTQAIPMNAAWRHITVELGTIRELIASGEMNLIQDRELRQRLIGTNSKFEAMNEQLSFYKDWYLNNEEDLFAGLYARMNLSADTFSSTGLSSISSLEITKQTLSSTINREEFLSKKKTRALSLMLAARNTMLGTFKTNLAYLRETAKILAEADNLR